MEFEESKVYTALNANKLKVGAKVIVADSLEMLKELVGRGKESDICTLTRVHSEKTLYRFKADCDGCDYALAYLVEEPAKLKWSDLKAGDTISKGNYLESMVVAIDRREGACFHILAYNGYSLVWIGDEEIKAWEKVEK
jgi:hypothetical protein